MSEIIYLVIGLVVGYVGGRASQRRQDVSISPNQKDIEEKQKNLDQILGYFNSRDEVTNNEVEKMLGVSDATAERYLDELERAGKIQQVGRTGRSVTYRKF